MSTWHDVATLKDLQARKKLMVTVGDTDVALFLINGTVYALADSCFHEQRRLSKGAVLFGKVVCPGHQWKFDPATGIPEGQDGCQPTFDVRVADDGSVAVSLDRVEAAQ